MAISDVMDKVSISIGQDIIYQNIGVKSTEYEPDISFDEKGKMYVGMITKLGIVTQGKTLGKLFENINEAIQLHFD